MLLTVDPVPGAYYNIGGTHSCTIRALLNDLIELSTAAGNIEIVVDPDRLRPIDADLQVPNTAKFRAHTGWEPRISYKQTLQDLLDYWRGKIKETGFAALVR